MSDPTRPMNSQKENFSGIGVTKMQVVKRLHVARYRHPKSSKLSLKVDLGIPRSAVLAWRFLGL
jgi:hypothetical protein